MDEDHGVPIHSHPQHSINLFVKSLSRMNLENDKKVVTITPSLLFLMEKVCHCFFSQSLPFALKLLLFTCGNCCVLGYRYKGKVTEPYGLSQKMFMLNFCWKIVQLRVLNANPVCLGHIFIKASVSRLLKQNRRKSYWPLRCDNFMQKLLVAVPNQSITRRHFSWIPTTYLLTVHAS